MKDRLVAPSRPTRGARDLTRWPVAPGASRASRPSRGPIVGFSIWLGVCSPVASRASCPFVAHSWLPRDVPGGSESDPAAGSHRPLARFRILESAIGVTLPPVPRGPLVTPSRGVHDLMARWLEPRRLSCLVVPSRPLRGALSNRGFEYAYKAKAASLTGRTHQGIS